MNISKTIVLSVVCGLFLSGQAAHGVSKTTVLGGTSVGTMLAGAWCIFNGLWGVYSDQTKTSTNVDDKRPDLDSTTLNPFNWDNNTINLVIGLGFWAGSAVTGTLWYLLRTKDKKKSNTKLADAIRKKQQEKSGRLKAQVQGAVN